MSGLDLMLGRKLVFVFVMWLLALESLMLQLWRKFEKLLWTVLESRPD